jgi:DNA-directed RNA polymerase specialized sigma24 family protein
MKTKNEFLNNLYVDHYNDVLTYLKSKVSNEQTAEDLT